MRICVWDTETTGFSTKWWDLAQQPYIIQFAAIVGEYTDGSYVELERHDLLFKPKIPIPFASSQVHGIYDADVSDKDPIEQHLDAILKILNSADLLVGHNIEYDEEILSYELARASRAWEYAPVQTACTMRGSTDFCKLQGRGFSYKPPKLAELHRFLFNEWFDGAHNAIVDVEATMRCLVALLDKKVIVPEETSVMRLF